MKKKNARILLRWRSVAQNTWDFLRDCSGRKEDCFTVSERRVFRTSNRLILFHKRITFSDSEVVDWLICMGIMHCKLHLDKFLFRKWQYFSSRIKCSTILWTWWYLKKCCVVIYFLSMVKLDDWSKNPRKKTNNQIGFIHVCILFQII